MCHCNVFPNFVLLHILLIHVQIPDSDNRWIASLSTDSILPNRPDVVFTHNREQVLDYVITGTSTPY